MNDQENNQNNQERYKIFSKKADNIRVSLKFKRPQTRIDSFRTSNDIITRTLTARNIVASKQTSLFDKTDLYNQFKQTKKHLKPVFNIHQKTQQLRRPITSAIKTQRLTMYAKNYKKREKTIDQIINKKQQKQQDKNYLCKKVQQAGQKIAYIDDICNEHEQIKKYKILSAIGKGAFSVVSLAKNKYNNQTFAIKTYQKLVELQWNRLASIKRQIKHLKQIQHPYIIKLIQVIRQRRKLHIILQKGGNQSLCGLLRKNKALPESQVKIYFKKIIQAIDHCHMHSICHRDIKPQNILVDEEGKIKIIDFGFSSSTKTFVNNYCGTPAYMAPQILKKNPYQGAAADIWALGVLLFFMLFGILPFRAGNEQQLHRLITVGKFRFRQQRDISDQAKNLVKKMLQVKPALRPTASQLRRQQWFV